MSTKETESGSSTEQETIVDEEPEMTLEQRTNCQLSGVDETWVVDEMENAGELKDAISAVREDHSEERLVETNIWQLKVYWNVNTDSVWVATFGYNGGYEVSDE